MAASREDALAYFKEISQGKDAAHADVIAAMTDLGREAPSLHSAIFSAGYGRGSTASEKKGETKLGEVIAERDTFKAKVDELQAKVGDLEKAKPDVAQMQRDYEGKLTEEKARHERDRQKLQERLQGALMAGKKSHALRLATEQGIDPLWAENVWEKNVRDQRIRFNEEDQLDVLEPSRKIPYGVTENGNGEERDGAVLKLLVEEWRKGAPQQMLTSRADRGADTGGDRGTAGANPIDEQVRAFQAQRDARPNPLLRPALPAQVPVLPGAGAPSGRAAAGAGK